MNEPNLHKTSQILRWKKGSIVQQFNFYIKY